MYRVSMYPLINLPESAATLPQKAIRAEIVQDPSFVAAVEIDGGPE